MAELVLSTIGKAIGSRLPGALSSIGAALLQAGGAALGRSIDQQLFGPRARHEGARLTDLHLQASTEGASIPALYGRVRLSGQVIWAARFKEHAQTEEVGGKGGPRVTSRTYSYTLSFAVGLCEGEIARIGRVWANGEELDLSEFSWRLHPGSETQTPDALVEAIEGADNAPAYRGLAYVVFEDMALERFGNTIPQLSFEVMRATPGTGAGPRFEELVKSVCLIPGSGEFVYATSPVLRRNGPGQEVAENIHAERGRANLLVSLDQLQADFPNCETVLLVVAWFGDDLRCGNCLIKPGVEIAAKETTPLSWRAAGVTRAGAHVVSQVEGAPAYGGTPSDDCVLQAIAELKARGYKVGLYPFVLMDVAQGNALPDPYGGAAQAAYPWRGRITLHPAAGQPGTPDKTSAATSQVAAFFGTAAPAHFGASGGAPTYSGPTEWSYRRFILHHAKLAALAGGVDAFLIGSEMRGLTTARDSASNYPAVTALKSLAADVRAMLGATPKITYAADWSEYGGHQPQDGTGDVYFHLDPLWSDSNIDVVGVDWYPPLTDWRSGSTHADASLSPSIHDANYLAGRIEAGENFDFFYTSDSARAAQTRTTISDSAYSEPWVFRAKDVRNFWARGHYNRPGGVRAGSPTAWVAQSKPTWFIELGCPAIDKGANAPNLFIDAKSDESALPPFSTGVRDDLIQRRMLQAYLAYWEIGGANNPTSSVNGKPMIEHMALWCYDARPHPAFPARGDVWTDGGSWRLGHWLNGRAGLSDLGEVVAHLCARADVTDIDAGALQGAVSGYIVDAPASARDALEPLMAAYDFSAAETAGAIRFRHRATEPAIAVALDDLTEGAAGDLYAERADGADTPIEARVRFLDPTQDYHIGNVGARRLDSAEGGAVSLDAPLVLEAEAAEGIAQRVLADLRAHAEALKIGLGPAHLALEPGDRIVLGDGGDVYEIARIEDAEARRVELRRARSAFPVQVRLAESSAPAPPPIAPTPAFSVLDLPPLPGAETEERPLAAVFAAPWLGMHEVHAGTVPSRRASTSQPAIMGELLWALWPGPVGRWDDGNRIRIKLYGGTLSSATKAALLDGANVFAIGSSGEWEIVQARDCVLTGDGEYELSGFLRGQLGSAHAMAAPHPVGARIVKLDERLARVDVGAHEWNEALAFRAPPAGGLASDPRAAALTATLLHAAARPWAPAHVRGRRAASGDVALTWIRCARAGGDSWGPGEPPLGAAAEAYLLDILDGAIVKRSLNLTQPAYIYTAGEQSADFGLLPASLQIRVSQLGQDGATGLKTELTITL
ncbi:MAG: glycoside hydrolase/phage tail family protein [Terricaulis sp.]